METRAAMRLWGSCFALGCFDYAKAYRQYSRDFDRRPEYTKPEHYEPIRWVNSEEMYPGSFCWLCELFDLDPERARKTLRASVRDILTRERKDGK